MAKASFSAVLSCAFALFALLVAGVIARDNVNNVIVMISDDLSPFYLDPTHPVKFPNIKKLAQRGTEFTNAHSPLSACGPARMALMTGRYPDTTNLFTFERYVPQVPGLKTIDQYMTAKHNYETIHFGKVFHEDGDPEDPRVVGMFQAGLYTNLPRGGGADGECHGGWFCTKRNEQNTGDYKISRDVVKFMSSRNTSRPLLAFVGFRRPHMDVSVPKLLIEKSYPGKDDPQFDEPPSLGTGGVVIPFRKSLQRMECYKEILGRKVNGIPAFPPEKFLTAKHTFRYNQMRKYYFAASTWIDSLVGYVVNYVDSAPQYKDNTAFIFTSDHGFSMGEHGLFCKNTMFDQSTRVALVAVPAKRTGGVDRGRVRTDPVNLIDIFPTIVHLGTGTVLPAKADVDTSDMPLDGRSVLQDQRTMLSLYTFGSFPRCSLISGTAKWQCGVGFTPCGRIKTIFMGYTVRTRAVRYVEWRPFDDVFTKCEKPNWPNLSPQMRAKMRSVHQIDPAKTKTRWNENPVQRELFDDYPAQVDFKWGDWEHSNALVDRKGDKSVIIQALELSAAIRWRFDAAFGAGRSQPCSGNGYVKLKNPSQWNGFEKDPDRTDVECDCLTGWTGATCGESSS